ncbi:MAG: histidinol dehydrogenase [Thermoleophilia bacterium]|nr:histidinol dehydrogenase [Thermoleophilia bacterium]
MSDVARVSLAEMGPAAAVAALRPPAATGICDSVAELIANVRERGDAAVVDIARKFDCPNFIQPYIRVEPGHLEKAAAGLDARLAEAIAVAADQVAALSAASLPDEREVTLPAGQEVVLRQIPVGSVGCYVPGGRAAYPSSLIMAAVPAQVAGVQRIAVVSPPGPSGAPSDVTLATAALLGIDEVYAAGGVAAVAALAFGTASIPSVDIIVGPGNSWVQEAKRQVCGVVGVDSGVAGPSEVVALVDASADPEAIALDLLAQAEHGPDSPAVAVSTSPEILDAIAGELERRGPASGTLTLVDAPDLESAVAFAEEFAPEHLQLNLTDAQSLAGRISRAGGTAFGDYIAGSNHILPTGGGARFASAVGPATYLRRMSIVNLPQEAVDTLAPHLAALADAEGFPAHRESALVRTSA